MPVVHYWPVIGGLETWTQNIAERLSDKAEIFVVTGKVKNQPKEEIKNGVKIFRTSLFTLKNLSRSSPVYILTALPFIFFKSLFLLKQSSNLRPSNSNLILHCQGFLSSFLGWFLSVMTGIPFVATVQRLENKNWLKKKVYGRARVCIAASTAIKKYFQEIGCKNIEVIPSGIDLNKFKIQNSKSKIREKLGIRDEFVIMTVARLEKVKGIQYLIEAFYILNSKLQVPNSKLIIIGDGSQRNNLVNLVKKLSLEDRVIFLGEVSNPKIPETLAAADCFVLPSLKEGFGIAILEAMAAGLPVIATNVGGIPDIIKQAIDGILVPPKNPSAIAEAMIKIYTQPDFAQNLVKNATVNLEKYNWQDIAKRVYKIYLSFSSKTD